MFMKNMQYKALSQQNEADNVTIVKISVYTYDNYFKMCFKYMCEDVAVKHCKIFCTARLQRDTYLCHERGCYY